MKFNFFKIKKPIRVGLALSGGGARGVGHIGAIKAFEENGIKFDYVAGTSAGSIVGALYAYGLTSEQMIQEANKISAKDIRTSKIPFVPSKTEGMELIIASIIQSAKFSDLKLPFCAVATDVKSGTEIYLTKGDVAKSVCASCAVPGIFSPVEIDNYLLFDGGLMNNIPSNVPKQHGCDVVIAVDLNSTRGQGTESTKYFDLMMASVRIMMKSNSLKGYLNADVMIKPDLKKYKSTKLESINDLVQETYNATIFKMDEIKQLIGLKTSKKTKPTKQAKSKLTGKNKLII